MSEVKYHGNEIAVISMSCRFPGADSIEQFWENLASGYESIESVSLGALLEAGVPAERANREDYVAATARLNNVDRFDADFFEMSAREAAITDPQHRLLLECAWEALDAAGLSKDRETLNIGVFAGGGSNGYLHDNVMSDEEVGETGFLDSSAGFMNLLGNDKDYLSTRIAYKLGLRGPSLNIQTACSTSLVSIHMACQSLLLGECDVALAGGVTVLVPHAVGYVYQEGMIQSPDGHCRAFDSSAQGTIFGSGAGLVTLKRLSDALEAGDPIQAVIKGSAINNDGSRKVSFAAPSSQGQAQVIEWALANAEVSAATIDFVESHGTGTPLGDPIEFKALTDVFTRHGAEVNRCVLGSVKTNIGHLIAAAGVAGFIKTVLALQHRKIPATLHFTNANKNIHLDDSPFFISAQTLPWQSTDSPRRAGVSSFGVGGTNAHVILEEAPQVSTDSLETVDGPSLLALCAKDRNALTELIDQYREMLERTSEFSLRDICYSARVGRAEFPYRYTALASCSETLLAKLRQEDKDIHWVDPAGEAGLVFVFTGQGAQFPDMGKNLYQHNEVFRASIDRCNAIAQTCMGISLLSILFPAPADDARLIDQTRYAQPALFALEYSLAQVWLSVGAVPDMLVGHSLGEFAAACVGGVFSLEDGMKLVAERGRLMQALPLGGGMSAITLPDDEIKTLLARHAIDLSIAAINAPSNVVVSGALDELDRLYSVLDSSGVKYTRLNVSHAFHSELMEPMLAPFASVLKDIHMSAPRYSVVSNVSGDITTERLATPDYWLDHVRQPVRFMACIQSAFRNGGRTFLEVGPKAVLSTIGAACLKPDDADQTTWITSLSSKVVDREQLLDSAGRLFKAGVELDWHTLLEGATSTRINTPTYPFQRSHHWIGPSVMAAPQWTTAVDWVEFPFSAPATRNDQQLPGVWLFIGGTQEHVKSIHNGLSGSDEHVVHAVFASDCRQVSSRLWHIRPDSPSDIHEVFQSLPVSMEYPLRGVVHLGASGQSPAYDHPIDNNDSGTLSTGLYSAVATVQAMTATSMQDTARLWIVTRGAVNVHSASSSIHVSQATLWGLAKVIAQEEPAIWGGFIDLPLNSRDVSADLLLVQQLILAKGQEDQFAIRHSGIHVPRLMEVSPAKSRSVSIHPEATYLVVGGLGGVGREVLAGLVEKGARHVTVVGRTALNATGSAVLDAFKSQGVDIDYLPLDISSSEALESLTSYIGALQWPLRGVLQLAGTVEDAVLSKLSASSIRNVLLPKLQGTRVLDYVTRDQSLDFFVAFSSISASLGFKGQANYVAANSAMDAIMDNRVSSGLPGLSIAWGPWSSEGMASRVDAVSKKRLSALGVNYISPKVGLRKLWDNLHVQGVLGLAPIDWSPYKAHLQPGGWPYLSLVNTQQTADKMRVQQDSVPFLESVLSVDDEQTQAFIMSKLMSVAARVSGGLDASVDKSLTMMGFDSLMTVEFRNSLKVLGINFPLDRLIVGATLNDIGDFVLEHVEAVRQGSTTEPAKGDLPAAEDVQTSDCVVIPVPRPEATLRLFCFPYAGGGPAVFKGWANRLPDHIELCLLQLPGRNARLREKAYTSMDELVRNLTPDLLPYLDRPFAFFGLCLGGVQAFEVAQSLASTHNRHPSHLIFAGSRAPHFYNEHQFASDVQQFNYESDSEPAAKDDDEDLIAMLKEMNFANNQALFDDVEMRDLMLPIIKADYEINNTYLYDTSPRLAVPITSIGGRIDPYATGVHITGWREHTTDAFKSVFCAGDHYFVEGQRDLIVSIVVETLACFSPSEITPSAETVYQ